jgi:hypothetical protein
MGLMTQLEEMAGPATTPSGTGRTRRATAMLTTSHSSTQLDQLAQTGMWENFGAWCLPEELRKLDDGVAMVCGYMFGQEELLAFTDEGFSRCFMGREELMAKFEGHAMLPALLFAT